MLTHSRTTRVHWPRLIAAPLLILAALITAGHAAADDGQQRAVAAGRSRIGTLAPARVLTASNGERIDFAALRGRKAVYLKFWATWCVPCREQMPHFEHVQRGAGDDLAVVAINLGLDDTPEQIDAFRREHGLTMPIVRDDDGALATAFGVRVTPTHVVVGRDGRIAYIGHQADAALDAALAAARQAPSVSPPTATATAAALPNAALHALDGTALPAADPQGRRSVFVFFSPWCESYFAQTRPATSARCRALRERLAAPLDARVRWIGIAYGLWTSEPEVRAYGDEHGLKLPLVLDADGALSQRYGVRQMPAFVVLDAAGSVLRRVDASEDFAAQLARATAD